MLAEYTTQQGHSSRQKATHLERAICWHVEEHSVVSLDTLVACLPEYSWNCIFQAVDSLARRGDIVLRRHRFDYSLFSSHYAA